MPKSNIRKNKKSERRKKRVDNKKKRFQIKTERNNNSIPFHVKVYDKSIVSNDFVAEIIQELKSLQLNDRKLFTKNEERFFKATKEGGFEPIFNMYLQNVPEKVRAANHAYLFTKIGSVVYDGLLKKGTLLNYIPFNDVSIIPKGKEFILEFDALLKRKTSWGTVHYSPLKPKIHVNGKEYIVSFTKHAIERICERTVYDWKTYNGSGDCFAYLKKSIKFDLITIDNKNHTQNYVTFYEFCTQGYMSNMYVEKLIDNVKKEKSYCYRVGYCPIALQGRFACAITLLTPGMKGTPEDILLKKSDLDRATKIEIKNAIQDTITRKTLCEKQNLKATKWFHDNGIHQVFENHDKLFKE